MKSKLCILFSLIMILCMSVSLFPVSAEEQTAATESAKPLTRIADSAFVEDADKHDFDYFYYQAESKFKYAINSMVADIKPTSLTLEKGGVILSSKSDRALAGGGIQFALDKDLHFSLFCIGDNYKYTFTQYTFETDKFVNVAWIYDDENSTSSLYIDGVLKEQAENVALVNDPANMFYMVGSSDASIGHNDKFNGEIKSVAVYGSVITPDIIAKDMAGTPLTESEMRQFDLMAKWNIPTERSFKVEDSSQSDNDLYLATHDYRFDGNFPSEDDFDYSFVVLPDTQYLTLWQKSRFYKMVDWINRNKDELNIKFVIHVGDIIDNANSVAGKKSQWQTASAYMSMLDGKVPYSFIVGNHDFDDHYSWVQSRNTIYFNEAFPYSKYSKREDFGGAYQEGRMDNTYYKLDIDGVKYLILAIEYCPRTEILKWADEVVESHPDYRVIVSTHTYLEPDATYDIRSQGSLHGLESNTAADVFDNFVAKHSNIMAVISGHIGQNNITTRIDHGNNGNRILDLVSNFQNLMDDDPRYNPQGYKFDEALLTIINVKESTKKAFISCYMPEYEKFFNLQNMMEYDFSDDKNPAINSSSANKKGGCGGVLDECMVSVSAGLLLVAAVVFMKKDKKHLICK